MKIGRTAPASVLSDLAELIQMVKVKGVQRRVRAKDMFIYILAQSCTFLHDSSISQAKAPYFPFSVYSLPSLPVPLCDCQLLPLPLLHFPKFLVLSMLQISQKTPVPLTSSKTASCFSPPAPPPPTSSFVSYLFYLSVVSMYSAFSPHSIRKLQEGRTHVLSFVVNPRAQKLAC